MRRRKICGELRIVGGCIVKLLMQSRLGLCLVRSSGPYNKLVTRPRYESTDKLEMKYEYTNSSCRDGPNALFISSSLPGHPPNYLPYTYHRIIIIKLSIDISEVNYIILLRIKP